MMNAVKISARRLERVRGQRTFQVDRRAIGVLRSFAESFDHRGGREASLGPREAGRRLASGVFRDWRLR